MAGILKAVSIEVLRKVIEADSDKVLSDSNDNLTARAPDGTLWRITIDNAGTTSTDKA